MLISLYEMALEIAGITGKDCKVYYGDFFGIKPGDEENTLIMIVPTGTNYIDPAIRSGIIHEAMHGKYTDFYDEDSKKDLFRSVGVKTPAQQKVLGEFMNAFEDIRVELKGSQEYPGCRWIFQDGFDFEMPEIFRNWDEIINGRKANPRPGRGIGPKSRQLSPTEQQLMQARLFLGLNISLVSGYYPYPNWSFPGYQDHDQIIEGFIGGTFNKWWERKGSEDFLTLAGRALNKSYSTKDVQLALDDVGIALRDTATSADCMVLAAKIFLPLYLKLLPPNSDLAALQQQQAEAQAKQSMAQAAIEAMAEAMKNGKMKKAQSGTQHCEKNNGSTVLQRAFQGEKKDGEKFEVNNGGEGKSRAEMEMQRVDEKGKIPLILEKAQEIKRILAPVIAEIKEYQETGGEANFLRKGALDRNRLYRVAFQEDNVFKKDTNPEFNDDIAFSVIIDTSGSMFDGNDKGTKQYYDKDNQLHNGIERAVAAVATAVGINNALLQIDRNTSVISFSTVAELHVEAGDRLTTEKITEIISSGHGGTNIKAGADLGFTELSKDERKSKIMFLITDGEVYENDLSEISKRCREDKVTPYFIFIGMDNRKQFEDLLAKNMKDRKYHFGCYPDGHEHELVEDLGKFVQTLLLNK